MFELVFSQPVLASLEAYGATPLPPYIDVTPTEDDDIRYQTVYATEPGAVAAPTAGLHFDEDYLSLLADMGIQTAFVTLHVGAGTFQPVRVEKISEHEMHAERYHVPAETLQKISATRAAGKRVIAVGTTSVRALESAAHPRKATANAMPMAVSRGTPRYLSLRAINSPGLMHYLPTFICRSPPY